MTKGKDCIFRQIEDTTRNKIIENCFTNKNYLILENRNDCVQIKNYELTVIFDDSYLF